MVNSTDLPSSLYGGAGNDTLEGGAAGDILNGGTGVDVLGGWTETICYAPTT